MHLLLAAGTEISVSLPAALTIVGAASAVWILVRLGDRLWGNKKSSSDLNATLDGFRRHCMENHATINTNLQKLSEAMTKYVELQQASLKIEEYRHESMLRLLEVIQGQLSEADKSHNVDLRELHSRLDNIIQSARLDKSGRD